MVIGLAEDKWKMEFKRYKLSFWVDRQSFVKSSICGQQVYIVYYSMGFNGQ